MDYTWVNDEITLSLDQSGINKLQGPVCLGQLIKMVVKYHVPNQIIEKYKERGRLKLAFLAGHNNNNVIKVTHLIIPTQHEFQLDSKFGKNSSNILRSLCEIIHRNSP